MDREIVWYPGHMNRAKRLIRESLPLVDLVVELLDARAPLSSRNPSFAELFAGKPCLTLLTKCSLADRDETAKFVNLLKGQDRMVLPIDCKTGMGVRKVAPAIRELMAEKLILKGSKKVSGSIRV